LRRYLTLAFALLLLNASLTFRNIWPTPAFWWAGDLSIELGIFLAALLFFTHRTHRARQARPLRALSSSVVTAIACVWMLFTLGHYADVTAPGLLGRPINLYWDVRFVWDVTAMFVQAAPLWGSVLAGLGLILVGLVAFKVLRWAVSRVSDASTAAVERRALLVVASTLLVLFGLERAVPSFERVDARLPRFAGPVTKTYLEQAKLVRDALDTNARKLPPTPPLDSDLSLIQGADVLLLFMESYGAVSWQRSDFVQRLREPRAELAAAITDTGRRVVSGFVESPTYGGSSWFAHISLLSGVDIRDPNANARLMTERRETLVTAFAKRGFRTVAFMPGLWKLWPEGSFYGFQEIYGGPRLDYKGPEFGWWDVPDQYSLAKLDELELRQANRSPVFVFFPTVSTHTPFTPTPPYQEDWARVLTAHPFDDAVVEEAFDRQPDWLDLSPSYGNAVAYVHQALAGFLRTKGDDDLVVIVVGDHQPPALVSGEGQTWDVPVHVIASRTARSEMLDRLITQGLNEGLEPTPPSVARMHELLPILLDAFGDREPAQPVLARVGD
jgi:Sulfatase